MIFKQAWKNIVNNKRRTILTSLVIVVASFAITFLVPFTDGLLNMMKDNFIKYETGHIRITTQGFLDRERFAPVDELIFDASDLIKQIENIDGVKSVEQKFHFGLLLGKGDQTKQVIGTALDLKKSNYNIADSLVEGTLEDSGLYIGDELAQTLSVKNGEQLLLVTQNSYGGLNGIKLPVGGVFHFGVPLYDQNSFFIGLKDGKRLLKIDDEATELFVYLDNEKDLASVQAEIEKILPEDVVAESYIKQLGALYDSLSMAQGIYKFVDILLMFLASFVIINTLSMALYERMPEIGMLKAIGMYNNEIIAMFVTEGAIIGFLGGTVGIVLGMILNTILSITGIDLSEALSGMGMPMEGVLYPQLSVIGFVWTLIVAYGVPTLAALIPAKKIKKINVIDALHTV